jgi:SAM-dependent methyltransferase
MMAGPIQHDVRVQIIGRDLVVDDGDTQEAWDSAISTSKTGKKNPAPATPKDADFRNEHGRRWHAFEDRQYWLPNDDIEINRLDLQHSIWKLSFDGSLHISPVAGDVQRVLDIGTGTGAWAIDFAAAHPSTEVIGTDLSPIQPENVPSNCSFMVHNAESDWTFGNEFDFIQGRMLLMGIHDWPAFFKKAWDNLKPGGWLEVSNPEFPAKCDDGSVGPESPVLIWSQLVREATGKDGIDTLVTRKFKSMIENQGFVNIREEPLKWPTGPWPKGEKEKRIGYWMLPNIKAFISPSAHALFTKKLDWPKEDVEQLVDKALVDLEDPTKHFYWQM